MHLSKFILSLIISSGVSSNQPKIDDIQSIRDMMSPTDTIQLHHGMRCGLHPTWTSDTNIIYERDSYGDLHILIQTDGIQICNYFNIDLLEGIYLKDENGNVIRSIEWD